jgi:sugar lactone lactonase YvrE
MSTTVKPLIASKFRLLLASALVLGASIVGHAQTAHNSTQETIGSGLLLPHGIAVDGSGNVYITDSSVSNRVLKETLSNGTYTQSTIDDSVFNPFGPAVDGSGNVYVADGGNNRVLKETLSNGSYTQSTIGTGLDYPQAVAVDGSGNVYISDHAGGGGRILKETPSGSGYLQSTVVTGLTNPDVLAVDSSNNIFFIDTSQFINGNVTLYKNGLSGTIVSNLQSDSALAVDGGGNVYVTQGGHLLLEAPSASGYIQSTIGSVPGNLLDIAVDGSGSIYITTLGAGTASAAKLLTSINLGTVNIGATSSVFTLSFTFDTGGSGVSVAELTQGVAGMDFADKGTGSCTTNGATHVYAAGDTCTVDVTLTPKFPGARNGVVQLLNSSGTPIASVYVYGTGNGPLAAFSPGVVSQFNTAPETLSAPRLAISDPRGNVYIADQNNARVLQVLPQGGGVKVVNTGAFLLSTPVGLALNGMGDLFISDCGGNQVIEVTSNGVAQSVAASAGLKCPYGLATDGEGDLFIADGSNNRVLKVSALGAVSQVATGTFNLEQPRCVTVDGAGNLYIGDLTPRVLKVIPNGAATAVSFGSVTLGSPLGVAVDGAGDLYVADPNNSQVDLITRDGDASVLSLGGLTLQGPVAATVDGTGNLLIADLFANKIYSVNRSLPPKLNFTNTAVGATSSDSPQTQSVMDIGNQALSFSALAYPADFPQSSSDANPCTASFVLNAGQSCDLAVNFTPTVSGALSESVVVATNSLNVAPTNESIPVKGTGSTSTFTISPATVTFPNTVVGATSAAQTITISNTGGVPLTLSNTTFAGDTRDFVENSTTCSSSLAVNASCSLSFSFAPIASGTHTVTITGFDSITNVSQNVTFTGTGIASAVTLSSVALSFAAIAGTSAPVQMITLTNSGTSTLVVSGEALAGAGASSFGQVNNCGVVAIGATCTLSVSFSPTTSGSALATLTITDNAGPATQTITLAGTGTPLTPAVSLSLSSLNFASTAVGSTATAQTITLTNTGMASLSISSIGLIGADAGSFAVTNTCGPSVPAGGTCTLTVGVTPTITGGLAALLTISDNATNSPQQVALTGSGAVALVAGFSMSLSSTQTSVSSGSSATAAVNMTAENGFSGTVTLGCLGLPASITCTFNPVTAMVSGSTPITAKLTISTGVSAGSTMEKADNTNRSRNAPIPFTGIWTGIGLCLLLYGPRGTRKSRRRIRLMILPITALAISAGLLGCGGGNVAPVSVTPSGSYTVVISGIGNSIIQTTAFNLTVQ